MILPGTIPVEHKSVHWLSMGAAGRNHLWGEGGVFQPAAFWERQVTMELAALWIALWLAMVLGEDQAEAENHSVDQ